MQTLCQANKAQQASAHLPTCSRELSSLCEATDHGQSYEQRLTLHTETQKIASDSRFHMSQIRETERLLNDLHLRSQEAQQLHKRETEQVSAELLKKNSEIAELDKKLLERTLHHDELLRAQSQRILIQKHKQVQI